MSGTILRPWTNQLRPALQVKPQGVPQIDWTHPLAQTLVSYWFDTGLGFYVDLVRGSTTSLGSGATFPTTDASPYGTGFKFPAGGINTIQDANVFFRTTWADPYAYACGWFQRGSPGVGSFPTYAGIFDSAANDAIDVFVQTSSGHLFLSAANSSTLDMGAVPTSGFHVGVYTTTGASAQTGYLDGVQKATNTLTNAFTNTGVHFVAGNNGFNSANNTDGPNASVFFLAIWSRRLTAEEAKQLYLDPYGLLVPAEPEMMILQPGAADVLASQIWL